MDRVLILLAVIAVTAVLATWWRARDGRVTGRSWSRGDGSPSWSSLPVEAADIAAVVSPSTPLSLVEFTAPDCAPCLRTHAILRDAVADHEDISVATLDVADALDLARAHRIMRAPTTVLISAQGHLLGRVAGVPRPDDLAALLDGARAHQAA